ncbi:MAG: Na(+)/H(+) antiporter subunit B [Pseudomonadota bacterium]
MKLIGMISIFWLFIVLVYGTSDFSAWGDPESPCNLHVSNYYIEHAMSDTSVPNIVTAILADYRGFDTMFETAVIFSAGIACFFLLRRPKYDAPEAVVFRHIQTGITLRIEKGGRLPKESDEFERIDTQWVPYDLVIQATSRILVPFIQLFALYVVAHGHHSPGGGFQGGVIFGAAIILFAVSNTLRKTTHRVSEKRSAVLCAIGVLIYAGTGVCCLLAGGNFLDYSALSGLLGVDPVTARSHGIMMVEMGVGLAVTMVMIWIYYNLSSAGKQHEGL